MIFLAGDKFGLKAIKYVKEWLTENKIDFADLGVKNETEDVKLEELIPPVVKKVLDNEENRAILSCGTGIGVEVGVNKFSGIRACLATSEKLAEWAAIYDKCNVLCLVGWQCTKEKVAVILNKWFKAKYDGDQGRLKTFEEFNKWH